MAATTLYSYYTSQGKALPSISERAKTYESLGLGKANTYTGTAAQNTSLLGKLQGSTQQKAPAPMTQTSQTAKPTSSGDLSSYLKDYQSNIYSASSSPELRESIIKQLEPTDIAKPTPLNRVQEFETMRNQMGVTGLETTLNDLKAQLETEYATKRARTQDAMGKPVAMGVIAGRVGEVERQEAERIDTIGRQINTISDQLNTSYNVINTYMNFMNMDYQDATKAYDDAYNRNLQVYKLVDEEVDEQKATAKANLQTFQNAILAGNLNYSSLPSSQKALITKLEVQSGLPAGFTQMLKPNEKVIYSGTRESGGTKYVDYITQNPDGSLSTKQIAVGSVSSGGSETGTSGYSKTSDAYLDNAMKALEEEDIAITGGFMDEEGKALGGKTADRLLSEAEANRALSKIRALVQSEEEANALFQRAWKAGGYSKYGNY